ncbi:MAG: hypothetical protein ABIB71_08415 [Candidatus Woesearchaeota archaeon]
MDKSLKPRFSIINYGLGIATGLFLAGVCLASEYLDSYFTEMGDYEYIEKNLDSNALKPGRGPSTLFETQPFERADISHADINGDKKLESLLCIYDSEKESCWEIEDHGISYYFKNISDGNILGGVAKVSERQSRVNSATLRKALKKE